MDGLAVDPPVPLEGPTSLLEAVGMTEIDPKLAVRLVELARELLSDPDEHRVLFREARRCHEARVGARREAGAQLLGVLTAYHVLSAAEALEEGSRSNLG